MLIQSVGIGRFEMTLWRRLLMLCWGSVAVSVFFIWYRDAWVLNQQLSIYSYGTLGLRTPPWQGLVQGGRGASNPSRATRRQAPFAGTPEKMDEMRHEMK